jgi:hypothetical protein
VAGCHWLRRPYLDPSWFLMRPQLNGGTLPDDMGIDVQLREHDEVLAEVGDPKMVLSHAARSAAFAQTRLLKYLSPWGDAIFNQAQAEDLSADIADVRRAHGDPQVAEMLSRLEPLVARLSQEAHAYLWFVGD